MSEGKAEKMQKGTDEMMMKRTETTVTEAGTASSLRERGRELRDGR